MCLLRCGGTIGIHYCVKRCTLTWAVALLLHRYLDVHRGVDLSMIKITPINFANHVDLITCPKMSADTNDENTYTMPDGKLSAGPAYRMANRTESMESSGWESL